MNTVVPANLTRGYRAAEAAFRKARDPSQRLESLREMLRVIPKLLPGRQWTPVKAWGGRRQ